MIARAAASRTKVKSVSLNQHVDVQDRRRVDRIEKRRKQPAFAPHQTAGETIAEITDEHVEKDLRKDHDPGCRPEQGVEARHIAEIRRCADRLGLKTPGLGKMQSEFMVEPGIAFQQDVLRHIGLPRPDAEKEGKTQQKGASASM